MRVVLRASFMVLAILLVVAGSVAAQQAAGAKMSKDEEALRGRVSGFYTLIQVARWNDAEEFVSPGTRLNFRETPKQPFVGFEVQSVKMGSDRTSATVVTMADQVVGMPPEQVKVPQTSQWRLVQGNWFIEVPKHETGELLGPFTPKPAKAQPAAPEQLRFKGHLYDLGVMERNQKKVAEFPFTNVTDHNVTITQASTSCDCLIVKSGVKTYKPGEAGALVIEFNPGDREREYEQTIVVKTNPGDVKTLLNIAAFIMPAPNAAELEAQKKKPPEN